MTSFAEFGLRSDILQGIDDLGFTEPTSVQKQIIPIVLEKQSDLVGLAQTGTGKTAAFGLPLIQLISTESKQTQALVLCPTRELCVQVARDVTAFAKYIPQLKILAVYGGTPIDRQIQSLKGGVQIIIATPGRLNDLIRRKKVDISAIRSVVLDEADEMLQMGFQDELNAILAQTPDTKNTLLFSATMSKEVAAIASKYMSDPVEITVGQRNAGSENIQHIYYMVQAKNRYLALRRIADDNPNIYSIIFCRTRQDTKEVAEKLVQDGYNADALHGDLSQAQRDQVMNRIRNKTLQMLVATDVAARGLDVNDLTHVINYNLPDDISNYTHRSGRTGRAGKTGTSIAIIHMREKHRIREIENKLKRKFELRRIPSGQEVCEKQLLNLIDGIKKIDLAHEEIDPFLPAILKKLASLDREELIKRFVSLEFSRFLEYYRNAPDLNVSDKEKEWPTKKPKDVSHSRKFDTDLKFTRFFLNVGKNDGVNPMRLIGEINDASGPRIKIGKIEIMNNSATLEADSQYAPQIMAAFQHLMINGKPVSIEATREKRQGNRKLSPRHTRKTFRKEKAGGYSAARKKNIVK